MAMLGYNGPADPLFSAVKCKTEKRVRVLLQAGADATARDSGQNTALHFASTRGSIGIIRLLLGNAAQINATNNEGDTPLHQATKANTFWVVRYLLEAGADTTMKNNNGDTPLHTAVDHGFNYLIWLLLEHEAEVIAHDYGSKRLHTNVGYCSRNETAIRLLLEKAAELATRRNDGGTPLHAAAAVGSDKLVRLLLEDGAAIDSKTRSGKTALHEAALYGYVDVIQVLLQRGASISAKDHTGATALHLAALGKDGDNFDHRSDSTATIRMLLQNGIKVHVRNNDGSTALHIAAYNHHLELIEVLLQKGADVNLKNYGGYTALHMAMLEVEPERSFFGGDYSLLEIVQLLLGKGARVNTEDSSGSTALHLAASKLCYGVTRLLVEEGGHINATNTVGATPLYLAALEAERMRLRSLSFVSCLTRSEEKALHPDAVQNKVVKFLLERGANVHAEDPYQSTALHNAGSLEDLASIKFLLRAVTKLQYEMMNTTNFLEESEFSGPPRSTKSSQQEYDPDFSSRSDLKMELPMLIGGVTVRACADTGSEENIIDAKLAQQLGLRIRSEQKDCKTFEIGNGNIVRAVGRTKAYCTFAKDPQIRTKCWFYVFAKLATPLIMGLGFLDHTQTMTTHQSRLQQRTILPDEIPTVRAIGKPRKRLACLVNGQHVLANADSGSEIDIMSLSYAKKLGYKVDRRRESRGRVMLADRTIAETIGQVNASIVVGGVGQQFRMRTFHVLPGLASDVLLGEDVLRETQAFSTMHSSFVDHLLRAGPLELNRLIWMGRVEKFVARSIGKLRFSSRRSQNTVSSTSFVEQQNRKDARENHRRELERKRIQNLTGEEKTNAEEAERRRIEKYDRDRGRVTV